MEDKRECHIWGPNRYASRRDILEPIKPKSESENLQSAEINRIADGWVDDGGPEVRMADEIKSLRRQCERITDRLDESLEENEKLKSVNKALHRKLDELEKQNDKLMKHINRQNEKIAELQKRNDGQYEELRAREYKTVWQMEWENGGPAKMKRLLTENHELKCKIFDLEERVESLQQTAETLRNTSSSTQADMSRQQL